MSPGVEQRGQQLLLLVPEVPSRSGPEFSGPQLAFAAAASLCLEAARTPGPGVLGEDATQMVLLTLTAVLSALTVVPGRATLLQSGVHLSLFAAFVLLSFSP